MMQVISQYKLKEHRCLLSWQAGEADDRGDLQREGGGSVWSSTWSLELARRFQSEPPELFRHFFGRTGGGASEVRALGDHYRHFLLARCDRDKISLTNAL
jgi:hypothetical protein